MEKVPCIQQVLILEAQSLVYFTLRSDIFEIQGCQVSKILKSEMYRMTYPKPNVWLVSLYDHAFSRYKVFENRKCTE